MTPAVEKLETVPTEQDIIAGGIAIERMTGLTQGWFARNRDSLPTTLVVQLKLAAKWKMCERQLASAISAVEAEEREGKDGKG